MEEIDIYICKPLHEIGYFKSLTEINMPLPFEDLHPIVLLLIWASNLRYVDEVLIVLKLLPLPYRTDFIFYQS